MSISGCRSFIQNFSSSPDKTPSAPQNSPLPKRHILAIEVATVAEKNFVAQLLNPNYLDRATKIIREVEICYLTTMLEGDRGQLVLNLSQSVQKVKEKLATNAFLAKDVYLSHVKKGYYTPVTERGREFQAAFMALKIKTPEVEFKPNIINS